MQNINNDNYSIIIAVKDKEIATPVIDSLYPLKAEILIGKDYPSFSKLVNDAILMSKKEIVIFCSHRVRPKPSDIKKMLNLLNQGYGLVGLFRFACFGFTKQLIRTIGFFDERYEGGGFEDDDFVIRMKEADIAYYEDESIKYFRGKSTWNYNKAQKFFIKKWRFDNDKIIRLLPEETYNYYLGSNFPKTFLPWKKSIGRAELISLVKKYYNKLLIS